MKSLVYGSSTRRLGQSSLCTLLLLPSALTLVAGVQFQFVFSTSSSSSSAYGPTRRSGFRGPFPTAGPFRRPLYYSTTGAGAGEVATSKPQQQGQEPSSSQGDREAEVDAEDSAEKSEESSGSGVVPSTKKRGFSEAWERLLQTRRDLFTTTTTTTTTNDHHHPGSGFEFEKPKYEHLRKWRPQVVEVETVAQLIKFPEPDVYIFDVRPEITKRILTAVEMTVFDVYSNLKLSHQQWQAKFLRPKPDVEDDIVVISWNGEDSEIAAILLRMAGYKRVYNCREGVAVLFSEDHARVDNLDHDDAAAREMAKQMKNRPLSYDDKTEQLRKQTFGSVHPAAVDEIWPADLSPDEINSLNVEK